MSAWMKNKWSMIETWMKYEYSNTHDKINQIKKIKKIKHIQMNYKIWKVQKISITK